MVKRKDVPNFTISDSPVGPSEVPNFTIHPRGRSAEFGAGHRDARPDQYTPPVEEWDAESLRTVEMERMHQLTSDKDY